MELLESSALLAITRAEVDVQIATAHRFPRSLAAFKKDVLDAVTLDPETAESCVYYRPVGKKKNDRGEWEEQFAEGPSIRMAEIVAACYGNIRAGARTIEKNDRFVKVQGVCHDLQKNVYASIEVTEPTIKKDGSPYDERLRVVIEKAAHAKAFRDAVFKVVPRAFLKTSIDEAKRVAAGESATIEQRREKVRQWLTSIKISDARVFTALSVKGWDDVGVEKLTILSGIKTAIKDGEITANDAFPIAEAASNEKANPLAGDPAKKE